MLIALASLSIVAQAPVVLRAGDLLQASAKIAPRTYAFPSGAGSVKLEDGVTVAPALTIRGENLVIDFQGATLRGTDPNANPNERKGLGVLIEGKNIEIRNLKAHGYKVGLMAKGVPGLKLIDCDLSYNWKARLLSTLEKEDLADWMSYHRNEKDEWLRYGAGAYLRDCDGFEVKGMKVTGGSNGLMLMECDKGLVWNSDLSFNSSLGIGMYLSSDNRIFHNKIDWNVRGHSYGVYNRGQDSAGILIYEQSHRNVFAYNSVTHSGDGFFLWAGQSTMDNGQGGCNDNVLIRNDFSHAPTNGIEATFSRNVFADNLLLECWHGIWGGYSYDSKVVHNLFGYNGQAIAWEHGQDNLVAANRFIRDGQGIVLWANPSQDPNWGYPKHRDTRSRDWIIKNNAFDGTALDAIQLRATTKVTLDTNEVWNVGQGLTLQGEQEVPTMKGNSFIVPEGVAPVRRDGKDVELPASNRLAGRAAAQPVTMAPGGSVSADLATPAAEYDARFRPHMEWWLASASWKPGLLLADFGIATPAPLPGGMDPFLPLNAKRGWRYILVDEWGPYDFRRPILWPRGEQNGELRFEILGPAGNWKLGGIKGADWLSGTQGKSGDIVRLRPKAGAGDLRLEIVWTGGATTDVKGNPVPAGKAIRLRHERFEPGFDWDVRFFAWSKRADESNARSAPHEGELEQIFEGPALHRMKTTRLDFASGGSFYPNGPSNQFATIAESGFKVAPGKYRLEVTTDDGIRVFVDGKKVIESWKYQGPTAYQADLDLTGAHRIRVEHFEIDGYAALRVNLRPLR